MLKIAIIFLTFVQIFVSKLLLHLRRTIRKLNGHSENCSYPKVTCFFPMSTISVNYHPPKTYLTAFFLNN